MLPIHPDSLRWYSVIRKPISARVRRAINTKKTIFTTSDWLPRVYVILLVLATLSHDTFTCLNRKGLVACVNIVGKEEANELFTTLTVLNT